MTKHNSKNIIFLVIIKNQLENIILLIIENELTLFKNYQNHHK